MRAYLVERTGYVNECEIADEPPVTVRSHGKVYLYRDRLDGNIAIYEEDETPTT